MWLVLTFPRSFPGERTFFSIYNYQFKDLTVRHKIISLSEENMGTKLHGIRVCNNFLSVTPRS